MKSVHPPKRDTPRGSPLSPAQSQQFAAVRVELEQGRRKLDRQVMLDLVKRARATKSTDLLCDVVALLIGEAFKDVQ